MSLTTLPERKSPEKNPTLPRSPQTVRFPLYFGGGIIALAMLLVLYIGLGSVQLSPIEVLQALFNNPVEQFHRQIVWDLRFPRGLVAILCGAMLGLSGAILQSITRNPLASPGLTGVSAGAVLAAVLWIAFGPPTLSAGPILPFVALGGGIFVGVVVYLLSKQGRTDPLLLALNGIMLGAILSSATSMVLIFDQERAGNIVLWLIGSLNGRTWVHWDTLYPWAIVAIPLGFACAGLANALHLGDDVAMGLGQGVERARAGLFFVAILLAAAAVSVVGAIGFIGLIGPHISRRLVGDDSRRLFPLSAVVTALILLLADFLIQFVTKGALPVGAVTAMLGAPFFLYLIFKRMS
jgi:iron complex transport system permease protein